VHSSLLALARLALVQDVPANPRAEQVVDARGAMRLVVVVADEHVGAASLQDDQAGDLRLATRATDNGAQLEPIR